MCEAAIGCSRDGDDSVKAEADVAEIASIAAPAKAAATPPAKTRVSINTSCVRATGPSCMARLNSM
jgi:hypothetical protein